MSERQREIDAFIHIVHAELQDLDDYLNQTNPGDLDAQAQFHSEAELLAFCRLAIDVSKKYVRMGAECRTRMKHPSFTWAEDNV